MLCLQPVDEPPPLPKRPTPGHPLYHYVVCMLIVCTCTIFINICTIQPFRLLNQEAQPDLIIIQRMKRSYHFWHVFLYMCKMFIISVST